MGEESVELTRQAYERGVREGIAALIPFTHEDIRIEESPGFIDRGTFRGHGGARELFGLFTEQFDDFRMTPVGVFAGAENKVVAVVRLTGVARSTRIPLQLESFHVHTVEDGKSRVMQVFLSRSEALQAAGLSAISIVRRLYEAIRVDNLTELFSYLDRDIEWHEWKTLPAARVLHGHDELRPYLETLAASFSSLEFTPKTFEELVGDAVLVDVHFAARARQTGEEIAVDIVHAWEIEQGRVVRLRVFGDLDEARAAL